MSLQPPLVLYHAPNQHEYKKLQLHLQFPRDFQATLPYPDPQQSWDLTRDDLELLSIKALLTDHLGICSPLSWIYTLHNDSITADAAVTAAGGSISTELRVRLNSASNPPKSLLLIIVCKVRV